MNNSSFIYSNIHICLLFFLLVFALASIKLVTEKQQTTSMPYEMCVTKHGYLGWDWTGLGEVVPRNDKLSEWMTISICVVKSAVNALQDAKTSSNANGISWTGQLEHN